MADVVLSGQEDKSIVCYDMSETTPMAENVLVNKAHNPICVLMSQHFELRVHAYRIVGMYNVLKSGRLLKVKSIDINFRK